MLEPSDIQGLVFSGYASTPFSRYWLVRLKPEGARAWLGRVIPRVTTGARGERKGATRMNVALSATGLRALGLPEQALATFPHEFVQGMAAPERSRVLGDVGANAPDGWTFGRSEGDRVDALVLSYATNESTLDDETEIIEDDLEHFGHSWDSDDVYLPADGREHFGFADGISNPRVRSWPRLRGRNPFDPHVAAGEFLLGHPNAYGRFPESPTAPIRTGTRPLPRLVDAQRAMDLGQNGTFLVLRKLEQDVAGFQRFTDAEGRALFPDDPARAGERFASLLVGRTPDGEPLARRAARDASDPNRFGYREDGTIATRCPIGAHVRRANPRDSLGDDASGSLEQVRAHRLLRRGRLYGAPVAGDAERGGPRGILFMALCANLRRQFEFVQETWLNNPKFGGLTHERDPLVGSRPPLEQALGRETFSAQGEPFRRVCSLERFVRVRGGAYLFMPGMRGLAYLAEP